MKNNTHSRLILGTLAITLALVVAFQFLPMDAVADPITKVQYKVVNLGHTPKAAEFEKILNDMASQGWTFEFADFVTSDSIVFRK